MPVDLDICEVRVTTFRRPELLKRALLSLIAQTHENWRCVVFDDCPDASARPIVHGLKDGRLSYSHNEKSLGAIGNIDQAFVRGPLLEGAYAFVLEDDNFLLSNHIEQSIKLLKTFGANVVFCNQYCEIIDVPGKPGRVDEVRNLDWMYEEGTQDPERLFPALLFSHGFSNGAAFWRTNCRSDFQIGRTTIFADIQESLRLLKLAEKAHISLDATSVWRPRELPTAQERKVTIARVRKDFNNRIRRIWVWREIIEYRSAVLQRLTVDAIRRFISTNEISDFANFRKERIRQIERSMLLCGYSEKLTDHGLCYRAFWLLLGYIFRRLVKVRHPLVNGSARAN